jgi:hypothetical protein
MKDPQPYKDPVSPPPADPQEDRPLRDPLPPDSDKPRLRSMALVRHHVTIINEGFHGVSVARQCGQGP